MFAAHLRHRDVDEDYLGPQFPDTGHAFFAVRRLPHQLEFGSSGQETTDRLSDERMVVGQNDAHGLHVALNGTCLLYTSRCV